MTVLKCESESVVFFDFHFFDFLFPFVICKVRHCFSRICVRNNFSSKCRGRCLGYTHLLRNSAMFANQLQEFNWSILLEGCAIIKARQVRDPPLKFASVVCASRAGGGDPRPLPPHHFRPLGSLSYPRPDIGGLIISASPHQIIR